MSSSESESDIENRGDEAADLLRDSGDHRDSLRASGLLKHDNVNLVSSQDVDSEQPTSGRPSSSSNQGPGANRSSSRRNKSSRGSRKRSGKAAEKLESNVEAPPSPKGRGTVSDTFSLSGSSNSGSDQGRPNESKRSKSGSKSSVRASGSKSGSVRASNSVKGGLELSPDDDESDDSDRDRPSSPQTRASGSATTAHLLLSSDDNEGDANSSLLGESGSNVNGTGPGRESGPGGRFSSSQNAGNNRSAGVSPAGLCILLVVLGSCLFLRGADSGEKPRAPGPGGANRKQLSPLSVGAVAAPGKGPGGFPSTAPAPGQQPLGAAQVDSDLHRHRPFTPPKRVTDDETKSFDVLQWNLLATDLHEDGFLDIDHFPNPNFMIRLIEYTKSYKNWMYSDQFVDFEEYTGRKAEGEGLRIVFSDPNKPF